MNRENALDWLHAVARLFCGAILVYASSDKIGSADTFIHFVTGYLLIPDALVPLLAVLVPWLEFLAGAGLLLGFRWRGAALVYCGLMLAYSIAISWNLIQGVPIDCGCFPGETEQFTWWTVLRDLALLVPGWFVLSSARTRASLDSLLERSTP
jgi:uncharacterized membrane protein YphA (DoxX/SURF4 family)